MLTVNFIRRTISHAKIMKMNLGMRKKRFVVICSSGCGIRGADDLLGSGGSRGFTENAP